MYFDYVGKENTLLKDAISKLENIEKAKDTTIIVLKSNSKKYSKLLENQTKIINNLNSQLSNQKELTKIQRKKKLPTFIKGMLLGGGLATVLILL